MSAGTLVFRHLQDATAHRAGDKRRPFAGEHGEALRLTRPRPVAT
jgi:hypothetical protein